MEQDFAKKVRQKRLRAVAVGVVVLAIAGYLIAHLNIEKADYGASLAQEIQRAEALYEERAEADDGDDRTDPAVLATFRQQIDAARAVAEADSGYTAEKEAYETLRDQVAAFRAGKTEAAADTAKQSEMITVSIEIRCDNLARDPDRLRDAALKAYVPEDGVILPRTEVQVAAGTSAFDLLNQVCRDHDIQLEASYTPAYESYYVEGINYLYEFDAGSLSGWMYRVSGDYVNYGSAEYTLRDGEDVMWNYTCDLGQDLGAKNAAQTEDAS